MNLFRLIPAAIRVAVFAGLCCMGSGLQAQTAASKCIVVDNTSAGFTASANWLTGGSSGSSYGGSYRYRPTASVFDPATWVSPVPLTGTYRISVWYPAGSNRAASAAYTLPNGATVAVNQQINGGQWVTLGTVALSNSYAPVTLSCWGSTGYILVADAVRYCRL